MARGIRRLRGALLALAVISLTAAAPASAKLGVTWMKGFAAAHQVQLAPHGKTTLSPTLFDLQLRDRAIAIMLR